METPDKSEYVCDAKGLQKFLSFYGTKRIILLAGFPIIL